MDGVGSITLLNVREGVCVEDAEKKKVGGDIVSKTHLETVTGILKLVSAWALHPSPNLGGSTSLPVVLMEREVPIPVPLSIPGSSSSFHSI